MAAAGRVIVVGSSNTDLVVPCGKLPRPGETVLGGDLLTFAGGKGANQAVGAARAGGRVLFIGAFGGDAFGAARRADLEKEGVDCRGCPIKKNVPSGVALIAIGDGSGRAKAENLIIVAPGANAQLTPADVRKALPRDLSDRDVVLCSLEIPLESVGEALRAASQAGAVTILNPAPYPAGGLPKAILKAAAAITPNETEFEAFAGAAAGQRASAWMLGIMNEGTAHIIVTQGAQGVTYHSPAYDMPRGSYEQPRKRRKGNALLNQTGPGIEIRGPLGPPRVDTLRVPAPAVKPVDTVGAGDCFNGSLAAHLAAHHYDFEGAIRFAVCAAALKVTRRGAQAGMPHRNEILKLVKRMK